MNIEALKYVQQRQLDRRDFLKTLGVGGAGALALTLLGETRANALETGLLPWDNQDIAKQRQEVAARFGWDKESKNTANWRPAGDGGWVFKTPDKFQHPIFIQGADGRGVELLGWTKVKSIYGEVAKVVAHRSVQLIEVLEGTVYPHINDLEGWIKLADEARDNRPAGQIVIPLHEAPVVQAKGPIPLFSYGTGEQGQRNAARLHGVPGTFSGEWTNWITFDGGPQRDRWAKLKANPNGLNSGVMANEAVVQGFLAVERPGTPAIPFVAHPIIDTYGGLFGTEMVFRRSDNPNSLWRNTFNGQRSFEVQNKTGVFPLPIIR